MIFNISVGEIRELSTGMLQKVHGLVHNTQIYCNELIQLSLSMYELSKFSYESLVEKYLQAINQNTHYPILYDLFAGGRVFGCLRQNYRKYELLKYDMNSVQLIFVSCDSCSGNNFEFSGIQYTFCDLKYDNGIHNISRDLRHRNFHLLPISFLFNNGTNPRQTFLNAYVCFGYPQHMIKNVFDDNYTAMIDLLVQPVNKLDISGETSSSGYSSSANYFK